MLMVNQNLKIINILQGKHFIISSFTEQDISQLDTARFHPHTVIPNLTNKKDIVCYYNLVEIVHSY